MRKHVEFWTGNSLLTKLEIQNSLDGLGAKIFLKEQERGPQLQHSVIKALGHLASSEKDILK